MHKSLCFRDLAGSQRKEALYHNMINTKHLMESTDDGGREFQTHQGWASFSFLRSYACGLSCIQLFLTLWTIACKAPLSTEFSRQEYWSGLLFPSPGDLPGPGIKPGSPALLAYTLPSEPNRRESAFLILFEVLQL